MPTERRAPDALALLLDRLNIANTSSPTGTQFLQAVGCAEAGCTPRQRRDARRPFDDDEVVVVTTGDGTTSEGEFWESLNTACNLKLPVIFLIEDNGYAISVPVEVNTAGGSISKLVASFPDLLIREVDGCDALASSTRWSGGRALPRAQGAGPRPRPRDPALQPLAVRRRAHYKTEAEREAEERARSAHDLPRVAGPRGHRRREVLEALEAQ